MNIRCEKCGEEISESSRCCLNCGTLNLYNEKTIKENKKLNELSMYYDKVEKNKNKLIAFKLSFVIDLLCLCFLALFLSFYFDNFVINFIIYAFIFL